MLYNNGIVLDQCIVTYVVQCSSVNVLLLMLYNNGILLDQCIVTTDVVQ